MTVVRALDTPIDPGRAWRALAGAPNRVALESAGEGPGTGRWTILAAAPSAKIRWEDERVVLEREGRREKFSGEPFAALRAALAAAAPSRAAPPHAAPAKDSGPARAVDFAAEALPFAGGAVGWLGYELGRRMEPGKFPGARADADPPVWFGIYGAALVIERATGRGWIAGTGTAWEAAGECVDALGERLKRGFSREGSGAGAGYGTGTGTATGPDSGFATGPVSGLLTGPVSGSGSGYGSGSGDGRLRASYEDGVRRIRELIAAGDLYQANLSARFEARTHAPLDVLWERLRATSPEPFAACVEADDRAVLCASMERMLEVREGLAETRPIKGTAARGTTPEADAVARAGLEASEKDRAELLMIVDIHRNDLGKVCVPGSVTVPTLFGVRTFAHVHHLEATVRGRLRADLDAFDALRALFPAGSITGAPKIRAMQVIEQLEPTGRGVYCGAIGHLGFDGAADFAVAIRTAVLRDGVLRGSAGGGIVWDSDPAAEWSEVLAKSRGMRRLVD